LCFGLFCIPTTHHKKQTRRGSNPRRLEFKILG
jgi:hypothetical protein